MRWNVFLAIFTSASVFAQIALRRQARLQTQVDPMPGCSMESAGKLRRGQLNSETFNFG
jgi:hypothetical protein